MANWQRGVLRLMRIANHPVTVTHVQDFTPWYRRIVFDGPEVVRDLELFPTLWLRLWVPNPAKGASHVSQRGYTFVDVRPDEGTFALDFVLHETAGPAGDWARAARLGDRLEVAITPHHIALPDATDRVVLAGDVTALPAINSWLAVIDESVPVHVVVEDGHDGHDALPCARRANLTWQWVRPGPIRGQALAEALASLPESAGLYVWAAGERGLVKAVRTVLKDALRVPRDRQFSQSYWIEGRAAG